MTKTTGTTTAEAAFAIVIKANKEVSDVNEKLEAALENNGWPHTTYFAKVPSNIFSSQENCDDIAFMLDNKATPDAVARFNEPFIRAVEKWLDRTDVQVKKIDVETAIKFCWPKYRQEAARKGQAFSLWFPDCGVFPFQSIEITKTKIVHHFRGKWETQATASIMVQIKDKLEKLSEKDCPRIEIEIEANMEELAKTKART